MSRHKFELVWFEVHWPAPLDSALALALLQRLAADVSRGPVVWETRSSEGTVTHFVGSEPSQSDSLAGLITSQVPGTLLSTDSVRLEWSHSLLLRITPQRLALANRKPSQAARAILSALAAAEQKRETAAVQVVLGRGVFPHSVGAKSADPTQSLLGAIALGNRKAPPELIKQMRDKSEQIGFRATVRLAANATSDYRRDILLRQLVAGIRTLQSPGLRVDARPERKGRFDAAQLSMSSRLWLSGAEALALLAFPLDVEALPGQPASHPKQVPLRVKDSDTTRTFGVTTAPGKEHPLGISIADSAQHTVVLGPTGSGKSTVFLNLIRADLEADRGMVIIDPKNDLINDVLAIVPKHRRDDIAVLDPLQVDPIGMNPLFVPGGRPELIADGILTVFKELFPNAFGPRVDDVTHAALLTLARRPGATLAWLPRLLSDARFRAGLIGGLDDPDGLGSFWAEYNALSDNQRVQYMGPVLSRLRQFMMRESLRGVLDQSNPRFVMSDVFTNHKVLCVPLNSGVLGIESSRLLGSLIVGSFWQHALARSLMPSEERVPVSFYADEMQEFVRLGGGDVFADALARSRSQKVSWHLAHQYRDQISSDMRAAVDANVRNKVSFGLGIKDAKEMAAMAPGLSPEDFMALPEHAIYTNLMRSGQQTGWVSGRTLAPPRKISKPLELIELSQKNYGGRQEVGPVGTPIDPTTLTPIAQATSVGRRRRTT